MKLLTKIGKAGGLGFSVYIMSILFYYFFWWIVGQAGEGFNMSTIPWWIFGIFISALYFIGLGFALMLLLKMKGYKKSD